MFDFILHHKIGRNINNDASWQILEVFRDLLQEVQIPEDNDILDYFLDDKWNTGVISVVLERRHAFYIVSIIAPLAFLSLTASLVFLLPAGKI